MGTRFIPDWRRDGTTPPGWTVEFRPEGPKGTPWELKHGEGHISWFPYSDDAVTWARKFVLDGEEAEGIQIGIPVYTVSGPALTEEVVNRVIETEVNRFVDLLKANANAYHYHKITHEEFHAAQVAIWDEIGVMPVEFNDRLLDVLWTPR